MSVGKAYNYARVPVVKGQAVPAWDPRPLKATGVTYATSPMGADHTAGLIVNPGVPPDQMWEHRLTARTPVPTFYLCGASTHPAGSVIALNGRNAAMAVLADHPRD